MGSAGMKIPADVFASSSEAPYGSNYRARTNHSCMAQPRHLTFRNFRKSDRYQRRPVFGNRRPRVIDR
jgi:hypothetical protein